MADDMEQPPPPPQARARRVSSRASFVELRGDGVISEGACMDLMLAMRHKYRSRSVGDYHSVVRPTYITAMIMDLQWALGELGYEPSMRELESTAIFVHAMLSNETRRYHGVGHAFEILPVPHRCNSWPPCFGT